MFDIVVDMGVAVVVCMVNIPVFLRLGNMRVTERNEKEEEGEEDEEKKAPESMLPMPMRMKGICVVNIAGRPCVKYQ